MPLHTSQPRVFRNQEDWFIAAGGGVLCAVAAVYFLLFIDLRASSRWFLMLMCAGMALGSFKGMRKGIYVDNNGIEVRSGFTSKRAEWPQIQRFELRREVDAIITYVDLRDGSSIPARALHAGTGRLSGMTRRAQTQVAELNRILEIRRGPSW